MTASLRTLLIDDSPNDALLIIRELERSGFKVTWERVESAPGLALALDRVWDVIICDWVMPMYSAPAALNLLRKRGVDSPVIVVSGQTAEAVSVTAMKSGANDVISKDNLTQLGPAVKRELCEVEVRRGRRRAEAAFVGSESRYRRLFESAKDGILILDADTGRIIDANPFLLDLLGYPLGDVMGKQLWELAPFRDAAANQDALRSLQANDYLRYENLPLETRDGRRVDVEFVSNIYLVDGGRVIQCNIRDITERRRVEQISKAHNAELEDRVTERTEKVEALNRERQAFADSVCHDVRAPLRHIAGFSKLLLEEHAAQLDTEGRRYLDRIQECTRRMGQIITDLLALSLVTQVDIASDEVDLSEQAEVLAAELRAREPDRRVEFVIPPGIVAAGDSHLLRIAMDNLIGNAWKYTSRHSAARIEIGTVKRQTRPAYFVRDDGAGFDMAHAGRLFAPFQRLHGAGDFEGTGIGLATVQRIVHRHGGEIWAESAVERGTTIYFTLAGAAPFPDGLALLRAPQAALDRPAKPSSS